MRRSTLLLVSAAFLGLTTPATGQAPPADSAMTAASCGSKRTVTAVAQTLGVNLIINRANAWVFDGDFARVDFKSWARNLKFGWQWDETQFTTNMFAHPYHGSLYFAAARANCLSFWESVPITFLGSWTWEYFGERFRPSLNDFWMTGFGGIVLGEMLHRVSAAILDEQAVGAERISREIAATAINPLGGLNRLLRGRWTRPGVNAADRIPESYLFSAKVGGRRAEEAGAPDGSTSSPTLLLQVALGDFFDTRYRAPFDVITMLAQVSPDGRGLNILRATGRLYGKEITAADSWHRHQLVINQRFDYVNNASYHFGEQSLEFGIHSRWRTGPAGLRVGTRFAGEVVMLGAIDALSAGQGRRTIDFGPGLGALIEVNLELDGVTYLSFYNRARYLRSVSGAPADHTILFTGLDVTVPITRRLGIGAYLSGARRRSYYMDLPTDRRSYLESRVYLTWTLTHGTPERVP